MLDSLIDFLSGSLAILACVGLSIAALAFWAFATSLPIAALWACFRIWCRLFGV